MSNVHISQINAAANILLKFLSKNFPLTFFYSQLKFLLLIKYLEHRTRYGGAPGFLAAPSPLLQHWLEPLYLGVLDFSVLKSARLGLSGSAALKSNLPLHPFKITLCFNLENQLNVQLHELSLFLNIRYGADVNSPLPSCPGSSPSLFRHFPFSFLIQAGRQAPLSSNCSHQPQRSFQSLPSGAALFQIPCLYKCIRPT